MRCAHARYLLAAILAGTVACSGDGGDGSGDDAGPDAGETQPKRIVAVGDNHADLDQAKLALQVAGVVDSSMSWIGGDTILVQTGDVIDRGVAERQVIDLYEELRPQAEAAGGQIVNMNGNHEIMTAYGDYRYMMEGACGAFADLEGLDTSNPLFDELTEDCKLRAAAFWPGGPYAQIIAEWPVVAVVQDTVFVHGGLHQKHIDYGIDEINEMTRTWLLGEGALNYSQVGGGTDVKSVDWDRTYSDDEVPPTEEDCANLASVLEQLGVVRMAVGHTVWGSINPACDELVWRIDTGMSAYYGGHVEVFEVLDGEVNVLLDMGG
jgi:hypothetical protein